MARDPEPPESEVPTDEGAPKPRVLIVDDTPANLTLLSDLLLECGYEVAVATNGPRALALAEAKMPDLIMLDVTMPEMSGYNVCRALKDNARTRAIPVLFLSALDDVFDKVAAFHAGAVDYITKPFQVEEVIARLETQLKLARLTRELEARNAELARRNEELVKARHRSDLVFSALAELLPGQVLDGKYRVDACIGAGGFGSVFRGTHLQLGRDVAVKVFRPSPGNDTPLGLARFRAEGAAACRVDHPNVVAVLDSGISETGIAYLVMELLVGHSLAVELEQKRVLPASRALEIAIPVCRALAAAHDAGVVHRDIKPSNVFLHAGRGSDVVKVVDFGIAKLLGEAPEEPHQDATMGGTIVGSPSYMSPERLLGEPYDQRCDVYSVGVMLYQMLSGELPLESSATRVPLGIRRMFEEPRPLRELVPTLPAGLESVVVKALARSPEQRPSAEELAFALGAFDASGAAAPSYFPANAPPSAPTRGG
jgi:CheY-like chemotaxis protein